MQRQEKEQDENSSKIFGDIKKVLKQNQGSSDKGSDSSSTAQFSNEPIGILLLLYSKIEGYFYYISMNCLQPFFFKK